MKNKVLGLSAAILLSAGIAFSFAKPANASCTSSASCTSATEACCDLPCPIEGCPIPCCKAGESCTGK